MSHPSIDSTVLEISLLGGFGLRVGGRDIAASRKARALLAYLATNPGHPASRDVVADLLWSRRGAEQQRHSLRQTLVELRRVFAAEGIAPLQSDAGTLRLIPERVMVDAARLRDAAAGPSTADWAEAERLYAGPFMDNFPPVAQGFDDWLGQERTIWADRALEAMGRLADSRLEAGDARAAVSLCERMLGIDPLREDNHRRLMNAYAAAGRRADAVRQYQNCVAMLRAELDVGPARETEELFQRLRTGNDRAAEQVRGVMARGPSIAALPSLDQRPSIAVLPFRQYQADPEESYFADGIVDDIVHALGGLSDLFVISRGSTLGYSGSSIDARSIGRELGVRYVLYGNARRASGRLRIGTELSETEGGSIIHSDRYEGDLSELFDLQDRISLNVVKTIAPHVRERELRRAMRKHPQSMTAFDLMLQALDVLYRMDHDSFMRAGDLLRQAMAHEPSYAPPYAYYAYWYVFRVGEFGSQAMEPDAAASARYAAEAVSRDPTNALALAISGHVQSFFLKNFPAALSFLEWAIATGPNLPLAWAMSSATHGYLGSGAIAVRHAEQAVRLSPLDALSFWHEGLLAQAHYVNGDYEQALVWARTAVARNDSIRFNLRTLIAVLVAMDEIEQATMAARNLLQVQPDFRMGPYAARTPFQGALRERWIGHLRCAGLPD